MRAEWGMTSGINKVILTAGHLSRKSASWINNCIALLLNEKKDNNMI